MVPLIRETQRTNKLRRKVKRGERHEGRRETFHRWKGPRDGGRRRKERDVKGMKTPSAHCQLPAENEFTTSCEHGPNVLKGDEVTIFALFLISVSKLGTILTISISEVIL